MRKILFVLTLLFFASLSGSAQTRMTTVGTASGTIGSIEVSKSSDGYVVLSTYEHSVFSGITLSKAQCRALISMIHKGQAGVNQAGRDSVDYGAIRSGNSSVSVLVTDGELVVILTEGQLHRFCNNAQAVLDLVARACYGAPVGGPRQPD